MFRSLSLSSVFFAGLLFTVDFALGVDDWPQFLGSAQRGGAPDAEFRPKSGPLRLTELWRRPYGSGYSSVSVVGDQAIAMFAKDGKDWVANIDPQTGVERWRFAMEATHSFCGGPAEGPLSTAAIGEKSVYAISAGGKLFALNLADGKPLWEHDLVKEFHLRDRYTGGHATSPLVDGNTVFVQTGGPKNNPLVAFDPADGRVRWQTQSDRPENANDGDGPDQYSSPAAATIDGVRQVICITDINVFSVRADDGALLWRIEEKPGGWASALPIPGDRVLLPLAHGLMLVHPRRDGAQWTAKELWYQKDFAPDDMWFAYRDGHLYGVTTTKRFCLNADSGAVRWERDAGEGSAVLVGSTMLALDRDNAELSVIAARPDAYEELLVTRIFTTDTEGQHWPPGQYWPPVHHWTPVSYAGGRFLARNTEEFVGFVLTPGAVSPTGDGGR